MRRYRALVLHAARAQVPSCPLAERILKIEFAREKELCDDALATHPMHPILRALVERNLLVCVGPLVSEAAGFAGPRRLAEHIIELPGIRPAICVPG